MPAKTKTFHEKLVDIQVKLKAPKNRMARFGRTSYNYRNAESILESIKPLLEEHSLRLNAIDEPIHMDGLRYVKVFVTLTDGEHTESAISYTQMGEHNQMSLEQAYGTALAYAKKTALGNLLCLDDSELDPDTKPGETTAAITKKEQKTLKDLVKKTETDEEQFFKAFNCTSYEDFPKVGYPKAFKILSERNDDNA